MKILNSYVLDIDKENDGVDISFELFSQGSYDRNQFRNVVRNVCLKISITNNLHDRLIVDAIHLGVLIRRRLVGHSVAQIPYPQPVLPNETVSFNFYAATINNILDDQKEEEGVIILNTIVPSISYRSSCFIGDLIEELIEDLEDDDPSNWSVQGLYTFGDLLQY